MSCSSKNALRSVFVFLTICCLFFSVYELTIEYLYDNVTVKIEFQSKAEIQFPAVTICNVNAFLCSKMVKEKRLKQLLWKQRCADDLDRISTSNTNRNQDGNKSDSIGEKIQNENGVYWDPFQRRLNFLTAIANISQAKKRELGHSYESLISQCTFAWHKCNLSDILLTNDKDYGNCYTFNSAWSWKDSKLVKDINQVRSIRSAGPTNGLEIVFNIEQNEYAPGLTHEAALMILIHDPSELPYSMLDQGISVPPGFFTTFQLKKKLTSRVDGNGKECASTYHKKIIDGFPKSFVDGEVYSPGKCLGMMWQLCVRRACGCRDVHAIGFDNFPQIPPCNLTESRETCFPEIMETFASEVSVCHQECNKTEYMTTTSRSIWPAKTFQDSLIERYAKNWTTPDSFRSSYGKLAIFFSTLEEIQLAEIERFTFYSLFSNYGGLFGVYIGVSVLSLMDFIEYLFERYKNRKTVSVQKQSSVESALPSRALTPAVEMNFVNENSAGYLVIPNAKYITY